MQLIWDDAALVINSESEKIMHSGIRYVERDRSMPPSSITPNSSLSDLYSPVNNVYYASGHGWRKYPIVNSANFKGMKIGFYLPLKLDGKLLNYNFELELTSKYIPKK